MLISVYNTVYGFLPESVQQQLWVKIVGIVAASVLLIYGLIQVVSSYVDYSYALVSTDGRVLKSKNFPYKVKKTIDKDGTIIFILEERYGDATDVKITPRKTVQYERYNAMDGVGIKFFCKEDQIPNFKIEIKK